MSHYLVLLFIGLAAFGNDNTTSRDTTYNIDTRRISVFGLSSGAFMAGQLHMSHSAIIGGAAIIAGGPYYCAQGQLRQGLGPCVNGGDLELDALTTYAKTAANNGLIDDLNNLSDDRVWLFHGTLDTVIDRHPTMVAAAMYAELISPAAVSLVTDATVVHGMPTVSTGMPCTIFGTPFLNACGIDVAGEILDALHGKLEPRGAAGRDLITIAQTGYETAGMLPEAFLYVPASCATGSKCGVLIALHGCAQSSEYVEDTFAVGAGFNEWAESNQLLVLYPQVASSKISPINPYGCWDWWGYTGKDYATRNGAQVRVIKATLDALAGRTL